jgi:hypothetical protein
VSKRYPEGNWQAIAERDQTRRQRAEALIEAGALPAAAHFYHAAMLFQHGDNVRDYWRGHELANQAAQSGRPWRWLAAAAYA